MKKSLTHPLQSPAWEKFRRTMGIDVLRTRWQGPEPAEGLLTFHSIPHSPWTIGYFPKGPAPTQKMLEKLKRIGKEKNAIFIQLEPNVISPIDLRITDYDVRKSYHPLFTKYTFILDLTKSEEELLKAMHSKTRYNLKVALKHGVIVEENNSDDAFEAYLRLVSETTERQGFYAHNKHYHRTMWQTMHEAGIARLFTASYQSKIIAAWIIFAYEGVLYYPYGTSSREHRDVMAPNLLLWEIARWGKKNGYVSFDLWGALGPEPNPKDPWFGFHRFKQGFNPTLVEFVGSYDLVILPLHYQFYKIADSVRWIILKLRKKI